MCLERLKCGGIDIVMPVDNRQSFIFLPPISFFLLYEGLAFTTHIIQIRLIIYA